MAEEVCPVELRDPQLREAVLVHCRAERIEPPGRVDWIIGSARAVFEQRFCDRTLSRLDQACAEALERLVADNGAESVSGRALLAELKADPGQVGLETLLREVDKLAAVRALGLPAQLFTDASEKLVEAWRARALHPPLGPARGATAGPADVLAALCPLRASEITDALVRLLIGLIHWINARADQRVERELTEDLRRVCGKEAILYRLAEAPVAHPDDTVRAALFPVVREKTLRELVREAKANEDVFQARVRTVLRGLLQPLPADAAAAVRRVGVRLPQHRLPAGDASTCAARALRRRGWQDPLLRRRRRSPSTGWCPEPGVTRWSTTVDGLSGSRMSCVCWSRCGIPCDAGRSTWGANRWRDPDDDLPGDFETTREVHYAAIRRPPTRPR